MGSKQVVKLEDKTVFLYANGLAQVTAEANNITPNEVGSAQVTLEGVPLELLVETVHPVDPNVRFNSKKVRIPHTYNDLLNSLVGKKVEDVRSKEEVTVNAVVWDNHANTPVFLVTNTSGNSTYMLPAGLTSCNFSASEVVTKPSLDTTITGLPTLEASAYSLPLTYLVGGVQANIHYTVVLTDKDLVLTGSAKFTNNTEKEYRDVAVTLIPGKVTAPLSPRDAWRMSQGAGAGPVIRRMVARDVTQDEVHEQLRYTIGQMNISTGTSTKELFTSDPLEHSLVNKVDITHGSNHQVTTTLQFKAPTLLPAGSVDVYSRTTAESGQITEEYDGGGATYVPTLEDEKISIPLRTPDTVQVKVKAGRPSYEQLSDKDVYVKKVTYAVSFTNAGKAPTSLDASLHLSEFQELEAPSLEPRVDEKTREWNVTLDPGQKQTLTYTLVKELYRHLNNKEVAELKRDDRR